jgi:hypothetical protein
MFYISLTIFDFNENICQVYNEGRCHHKWKQYANKKEQWMNH